MQKYGTIILPENLWGENMAMWNPWRGCKKCSDGCLYCYIHKGDAKRGVDTRIIEKTKDFAKPTERLKKRKPFMVIDIDKFPHNEANRLKEVQKSLILCGFLRNCRSQKTLTYAKFTPNDISLRQSTLLSVSLPE